MKMSEILAATGVYAELSVDGRTTDERRTPKLSDQIRSMESRDPTGASGHAKMLKSACMMLTHSTTMKSGCIRFTSEMSCKSSRSFDPALQPAGRPLWASVSPEPPNESNLTEFSMTIERLITR